MALLLAAYGAANHHSQRAIRNFEAACRERFDALPVRWAFTSVILRERMANMRKKSDSILKALEKLWHEKYLCVAIQPLQAIPGQEYNYVAQAAQKAVLTCGLDCEVGQPLMSIAEDAQKVAAALAAHLPEERKTGEDVVFVGHGARHENFYLYRDLACALSAQDRHLHLGAMSGDLPLENILPGLHSEVIWLIPLLSVIGRHAGNDICGDGPASWRSQIERAGHKCLPVLRGISEYHAIAEIWLDNLAQAVATLARRNNH